MNNKILSVVLVAGIATTGFAGFSAANEGLLGENIEQKVDAIEERFENKFHDRKHRSHGNKFGKRKGLKHLTDEEKVALEAMSDEEKKAFFDAKKVEMKAKKEAKSALMAGLIAGETLTAEQETLRAELLTKIETRMSEENKMREGAEVMVKLLSGETLTAEEQETLTQMQEKRAERKSHRKGKRGHDHDYDDHD